MKEEQEEINRDFETNKARSIAQSKLQAFQSYYSVLASQAESQFNPISSGSFSDSSGAASGQTAQSSARDKPASGGMSDADRASVRGGGF